MTKPLLQMAVISVLALAAMFYPFMPGPYDRLAVALSGMMQALGFTGLLLVPIGVLWLIYDRRDAGDARHVAAAGHRRQRFGYAALGAAAVIVVAMTMAASQSGPSLALLMLTAGLYLVARAFALVRRWNPEYSGRNRTVPLFLIVIPIVLVVARMAFFEIAAEVSRNRTIRGSTQFINAIESYRTAHGHYPPSSESAHHDYDPPTVGVEMYRYEPHGESYNVFFEHPAVAIGTREYVMYNPRDEHAMIVHNQDLLETAPSQVEDERRYHARAARDAGVRHWKYFLFD